MIRINKSREELESLALEHASLLEIEISSKITANLGKNKSYSSETLSARSDFYSEITDETKNNLNKILTGCPETLEELINGIVGRKYIGFQETHIGTATSKKDKADKKKEIKSEVLEIFNYTNYSTNHGYAHVRKLGQSICPYCNRQYIFTLEPKTKGAVKCRAQLDHFLDKATYPYLALSFFNLIPSCSICNSNMKLGKRNKFKIKTHIHPLWDTCISSFRFVTNVKSIEDLTSNKGDILIEIENTNADNKIFERLERSLKSFGVIDLYNMHQDLIQEIVHKAYNYGPSKLEELSSFQDRHGNKLFSNKNEAFSVIFGQYLQPDDFDRRLLSKLIHDIIVSIAPELLLK